jgi:trans-2,3-dihydro-3-hydroxyanthranilate isomerase
MQVDAFTNQPLHGNPCAVIFETDELDAATMLAAAREMNLSETAFVRRASETSAAQLPTFGARYFTPAEEIPMAGHPTIATTFALVKTGRVVLSDATTHIQLELQAGPMPVEIHADGDKVTQIVMTQQKPVFMERVDPAQALPAFGLAAEEALPSAPVQVVSTGTPQLMIPLRSAEALKRAQMDMEAYSRLQKAYTFFSPHLFCLGGATENGDTFARHFGTPPDLMEDPFTGSATGGMAAYLWRYGLIEGPIFSAEQGHWMGRPGTASVEVLGLPGDIQGVRVGGAAVAVMEGQIRL